MNFSKILYIVSSLIIWVKLFYRVKYFEVLCEAFPQSVLGIYMVLVLQQDELLNYLSITISLVSLVCGIAESATWSKFGITAPFSKVFCSGLSGIVDTAFRVIFISLFASKTSPYALFLIPIAYVLFFYLSISIKHKNFKLTYEEFAACFLSLPSSTYEAEGIDYTLRPKSKLVFNVLALTCLCFETGNFWEEYPRLEPKVLPVNATAFDYCQNVCNVTDVSICSTFNQSQDLYYGILICLWALLALSTLEGILERFLSFMPHCKFLEEIQSTAQGNSIKGIDNKTVEK